MTSYVELFGLIVILMLPFLYESSHIFRYYFKFCIYYGVVSFNAIILIPAFLLRPCDVRNLLWASTFCHRVTALIGLKWELRGREHLEKDQACIIVANHQSSLDVLGMFGIWHVMNKCTVVAKRELFYCWPFGLAAWLAGLIFIDRVKGEKARDILNAVNSKVKKQKIKLWVFPEGTRRNTGELHSFKKGAFHMAIDEQIPILPVVFSSYCTFLNDKKKILNAGNIIITTLPPIPTEGLTKDDLPDLMERVHKVMSEALKLSSNEILQRYASNVSAMSSEEILADKETTTTNNKIADSRRKVNTTIIKEHSPPPPPPPLQTTTISSAAESPLATSQAQDIVNTSSSSGSGSIEAPSDYKDTINRKTKTQALVH